MRKTLIINAGSSSIKFKLYTMPGYVVDCEGIVDRIGISGSSVVIKTEEDKFASKQPLANHEAGISLMLKMLTENGLITDLEEITYVGHRVVQGGELYKNSVLVDEEVLANIYDLAKLAPLHNVPNGDGIKIFMNLLPNAKNVAVFDTEFHQTMEPNSYLYAVPYSWYTDYDVRRYGMHGTSHKYIANTVAEMHNNDNLKLINCHLGNGASLAAINGTTCVTTSMGLTPLAGIMMGTRSGDIDPSIIEYMCDQTGKGLHEITEALNKESGMLGLSGISSDMRDIEDAIERGNPQAILAMDIYATRVAETIGSYFVRLGGLDVITFTGGIGENGADLRRDIISKLSAFGIELDEEINQNRKLGTPRKISTENSKIEVAVIATDEEFQIANECEKF